MTKVTKVTINKTNIVLERIESKIYTYTRLIRLTRIHVHERSFFVTF